MNRSTGWEDIGPFRALVNPAQRSPELILSLSGLATRLDQGMVEQLRTTPFRTVRLHLMAGKFEHDVVVQVYPEETLSKTEGAGASLSLAARAYRAAESLIGLGIGSLTPLACLERRVGSRLTGSYFLMEQLEGGRSFDRELVRLFHENPNFSAVSTLVAQVARALRDMHELGVFHRALSNRSILIGPAAANRPPRILFTDLFRARCGHAPTIAEQARDIAGLNLPPRLRRLFWETYWGAPSPRGFEWHERIGRKVMRLVGRTPMPARWNRLKHPPSRLPSASEQWLWDESSRAVVDLTCDPVYPPRRAISPPSLITQVIALRIYNNLFQESVSLEHFLAAGIYAQPDSLASEVALLGELGIRDAMARFCRHDTQANRHFVLAAIQKMAQSGFNLSGVLVQDRLAVRDPGLWSHFVNQILGCVGWQLRRVELGHAVNLPAWGVRTWDDYRGLVGILPELQNAYPGVGFTSPGMDGVDPRFARKALIALPTGCRLDACAVRIDEPSAWHTLSDDGLLRHCAGLVAAISRQGNCRPSLVISEMRRVRGGPDAHEDAGRIIRRMLLLTSAGLVEQTVLWWLAGGMQTGSDADPIFQALARLRSTLMGGRFVRRVCVPDRRHVFILQCETVAAQPVWVGWVDGPPRQIEAPFRAASAMDIHGRRSPLLPYPRLRLTRTPVFFYEN